MNTPVQPVEKKGVPKSTFAIGGVIVVALIAIAVAVYSFVLKPTQIKEKLQVFHPVFEDYHSEIKKISDHLKEDDSSNSDTETIEREIEKAKNMITSAEKMDKVLSPQLAALNFSETETYKKKVSEYQTNAKRIVEYEKESVAVAEAMLDPLKKYEKASLELSGISNYMYSQPEKYLESIDAFIKTDKDVISQMSSYKPKGQMAKVYELIIEKMQIELDYITQMREAVDNRSSKDMTDASKTYSQKKQEVTRELNRADDKYNESMKDVISDSENLYNNVKDIYSGLRGKYGF